MPAVPAPNFTPAELELLLEQAANRYRYLKDDLDRARWELADALKAAVKAGIGEQRLCDVSGLGYDRVHQMVKSYVDPRTVRL